jgi:hypothetical protein
LLNFFRAHVPHDLGRRLFTDTQKKYCCALGAF